MTDKIPVKMQLKLFHKLDTNSEDHDQLQQLLSKTVEYMRVTIHSQGKEDEIIKWMEDLKQEGKPLILVSESFEVEP